MVIETRRIRQGKDSTLGELYVDSKPFGYVLEDKDRGLKKADGVAFIKRKKVYGSTAIPIGSYEIGLTLSKKFGNVLWPELLGVPGFSDIRPHAGNYIADTFGCQLIGTKNPTQRPSRDVNGYWRVWDSRTSWGKLKVLIFDALHRGEAVTWQITTNYDKPDAPIKFL